MVTFDLLTSSPSSIQVKVSFDQSVLCNLLSKLITFIWLGQRSSVSGHYEHKCTIIVQYGQRVHCIVSLNPLCLFATGLGWPNWAWDGLIGQTLAPNLPCGIIIVLVNHFTSLPVAFISLSLTHFSKLPYLPGLSFELLTREGQETLRKRTFS